jgi:signal transduction histidine kinase
MSESTAGPPRIRPRHSLSGRLWALATLAVLISEVVAFLPYIAHERSTWLADRMEDASITALAVSNQPVDAEKQDALLRLFNTKAIRLTGQDGSAIAVGDVAILPAATMDLREEDLFVRIQRAVGAVVLPRNRLIKVTGDGPFHQYPVVEVWLGERALDRALWQFTADFAGLAMVIAIVSGGLVYLALLLLLVRPMRRITGSIAAFRADPERTTPLDPSDVTVLPHDEISVAGQELAAMQHELRAALWRNARLAALGTMVAKVSHDLRGILTPALLTAERLQLNPDPRVRRAGDMLVQAVDRATDLVRRTLDYAREGPPALDITPIALAPLVSEAADSVRPLSGALRIENRVDAEIRVPADRNHLFRVLANLMRNAAEAGAHSMRVGVQVNSPTLAIELADDGPGLPEPVRADLFRPFAGSMRRGGTGLGLAIARDLMVAHGGDIELVDTGATGTTFRLMLRLVEPMQATEPEPTSAAPAAPADA